MAEEEATEEVEDITFTPGWIVMTGLSLMNEAIDYVGVVFNITGIWTVIVFILNLITLVLIMGWRMMTASSSFIDYCGGKRGVILLIVEHLPIIGDLVPGWFLFMLGIRKKKVSKLTQRQQK